MHFSVFTDFSSNNKIYKLLIAEYRLLESEAFSNFEFEFLWNANKKQ